MLGFHVPLAGRRERGGGSRGLRAERLHPDRRPGEITLVMPQVEMGQGTYTSISMILAEELDADWSRVKVEHAPPDEKLYTNPMLGMQATGNSNSIRAFWTPLQKSRSRRPRLPGRSRRRRMGRSGDGMPD